jgi:hypothetical protein
MQQIDNLFYFISYFYFANIMKKAISFFLLLSMIAWEGDVEFKKRRRTRSRQKTDLRKPLRRRAKFYHEEETPFLIRKPTVVAGVRG